MTLFRSKANTFFPPVDTWEYQTWEGEWEASSLVVEDRAAFVNESVACDLPHIYNAGGGVREVEDPSLLGGERGGNPAGG